MHSLGSWDLKPKYFVSDIITVANSDKPVWDDSIYRAGCTLTALPIVVM